MNEQLLIYGLDTRSIRSLVKTLEKTGAEYRIEKEAPDGAKHAIPLDIVAVLSMTAATLSGIALWASRRGKDVDLEASAGPKGGGFRLKITGDESKEEIEKELRETYPALSAPGSRKKLSSAKKASPAKKASSTKKAAKKTAAKKGGSTKKSSANKATAAKKSRAR